ncbi:hypothetical protein B0H17DRAFT_1133358 [Mycena rosella]|uniref:Uncharacterized protein n=1 Tax=Mycena rosella TaxID=1033263 RepID=A0AAD7DK54_MYCRO|nr:hypothetical protein B0H17DRAFT_1133358 [Mycena rosella]
MSAPKFNSQQFPEGFRRQMEFVGQEVPTADDVSELLELLGAPPGPDAELSGDMFENLLIMLGQHIEFIGLPPQPGDVDDTHFTAIPQDAHGLSLRFFPGRTTIPSLGCCFMDLYDPAADEPVPKPVGYTFYHHHQLPGDIEPGGRLHSMEEAFGAASEEGVEKFPVTAGDICELRRPGREPFIFMVPSFSVRYKVGFRYFQFDLLYFRLISILELDMTFDHVSYRRCGWCMPANSPESENRACFVTGTYVVENDKSFKDIVIKVSIASTQTRSTGTSSADPAQFPPRHTDSGLAWALNASHRERSFLGGVRGWFESSASELRGSAPAEMPDTNDPSREMTCGGVGYFHRTDTSPRVFDKFVQDLTGWDVVGGEICVDVEGLFIVLGSVVERSLQTERPLVAGAGLKASAYARTDQARSKTNFHCIESGFWRAVYGDESTRTVSRPGETKIRRAAETVRLKMRRYTEDFLFSGDLNFIATSLARKAANAVPESGEKNGQPEYDGMERK